MLLCTILRAGGTLRKEAEDSRKPLKQDHVANTQRKKNVYTAKGKKRTKGRWMSSCKKIPADKIKGGLGVGGKKRMRKESRLEEKKGGEGPWGKGRIPP